MIVVRRPDGALPFDEDDDQALTELARQVGLALHNVKLDSALQESLDEVRRQADELRASRARIVEAGDAQRRRIERDLHDGAQQHLVALAVNVNLARQIADTDPDTAKAMLEQIGTTCRKRCRSCATSRTASTRRLLMDRGLPRGALRRRGPRRAPHRVEADGVGRYPQPSRRPSTSAASRRCRTRPSTRATASEAMVSVREDEGALLFEVADDGAGFDLATGAHHGHGFVNMSDRVGAIGGTIEVESAPGAGTTISGRHPARRLAQRDVARPAADRAARCCVGATRRRGRRRDRTPPCARTQRHRTNRRRRAGRPPGRWRAASPPPRVGGGDPAGCLDAVDARAG